MNKKFFKIGHILPKGANLYTGLICPKCLSTEVYYENAKTGSGKYTCQYCEFMGNIKDFKVAKIAI